MDQLESNMSIIAREDFKEHLDNAHKVVSTWPAWKQEVLGGTSTVKPVDWLPYIIETAEPLAKGRLQVAYSHSQMSPDPSTKLGAVVCGKDGFQIGHGCNTFPPGVKVTPERLNEREVKLAFMEHAECNALWASFSATIGSNLVRGGTLYCPWYSCSACARAIICAGIKKVVGHKRVFDLTPDRWRSSISFGIEMLAEAGVICEVYNGVVFPDSEYKVLFNGEWIHV